MARGLQSSNGQGHYQTSARPANVLSSSQQPELSSLFIGESFSITFFDLQVKQPLPRESDLQREKFQKTVNQNLRRIEQRLKPGDCKSTQHLKVYEEKQVTFSRLKPNNADSLHIPKNKCFKLRELSPARGREHACRKVERPGTSQTVHFSKIQSNVKLKTKADDFHKKQVRNTSNQSKQVLRIGTHANNADLKKSCCLYNTARKFGKKRTCLIQNDDGSYTRKTIVLVSFPRNPHKFSISCSQQQSTPSQLSSSSYTTCTGQKEEADIAQNAFLRGKSALGSHSSLYVKCPNQKIDFHENDAHWDVRKTDIYLQKEASANCPIPPQSTRLKPLQQRIPLTTPLESLSANEMSSTVTVAPRRAKPLKYKSAGSRRETDASSVVSNLAKSFLCGTCFEMDAYDENSSSLDSGKDI